MKTMKEMANLENMKPKVKRRMRWWTNRNRRACGCECCSCSHVRGSGQHVQEHADDVDDGGVDPSAACLVVVFDPAALAHTVGRTRVVHFRRGRLEADGAL